LLNLLARYIDRRIAGGYFRPVPDAPTAARFLLESVAWFAWHRRGDPDSAMITDDAARTTVIDLLTASLLKENS
jgi:hypothetical protein